MDTNPFAVSPNAQQQQYQTPSYLKPTQDTGTGGAGAMNNVANMVKAMMDGNSKFQQKSAMNPAGAAPTGAPMSLAPPAPGPSMGAPSPMTNPMSMPGAGGMPPMGAQGPMPDGMAMSGAPNNPFTNGASPMGIDPVTQALFSPIPGGNGGQQF